MEAIKPCGRLNINEKIIMDLPKAKFYSVMCKECNALLHFESQQKAELACYYAFQNGYIENPLGITIGFGRFRHICQPEKN